MGANAKLAAVAVLFAVTLAILGVAAAAQSFVPLFFTWVPLLAAVWVLIRPEPKLTRGEGEQEQAGGEGGAIRA